VGVITADHGEAFGERNFYRHPVACPLSYVRKVSWVEMTAMDTGSVDPTAPDPDRSTPPVPSRTGSNSSATSDLRSHSIPYSDR